MTTRRQPLPPGQTPPIIPGQTVPTPQGGGGGGGGNAPLPVLTQTLRDRLEKLFDNEGNFGPKAGPTEAAVRRLMRQGLAQGLSEKEVGNFLNPAFYRGINDPSGGGKLLHDLNADQLKALAKYAGKQSGSGLEQGGSTQAQADFFGAFPDLHAKYLGLLGWSEDRIAVAQETGHDPGVAGSASPWYVNWQAAQANQMNAGTTGSLFQPFTNFTAEQTGVPGYPVTSFGDYGTAMDAAQTALASHYASAAAAGDFNAAGTAFTALQQHQTLMPQNTGQSFSVPDTFSEQDLHLAQQYQ